MIQSKRKTENQETKIEDQGSSAGTNSAKNEFKKSDMPDRPMMSQQRTEKVKTSVKTNSSVPDVVFYQPKTEKKEKKLGFIQNDSEEHFGKLARKGGEILLPGVFPQTNDTTDHAPKSAEMQARKSKTKDSLEVPNSDTEMETLLFFGPSPSSEVNFAKLEATDAALDEDSVKKKVRASCSKEQGPFQTGVLSTGSEPCSCCDLDCAYVPDASLQAQQLDDKTESTMEEFDGVSKKD
ncbi:UNVERIFIED_CONTAM: hypothetical protein PYX00_009043 [Menopon gallinae]|uniref:Breast cancer susceptibility 1 n=1 Tax=Menopon gallinae TaxID=328185 RepID=A0AAW2H9Y7_9NEOP